MCHHLFDRPKWGPRVGHSPVALQPDAKPQAVARRYKCRLALAGTDGETRPCVTTFAAGESIVRLVAATIGVNVGEANIGDMAAIAVGCACEIRGCPEFTLARTSAL